MDAEQSSSFSLWLLFKPLEDMGAAFIWLGADTAMLQLKRCFARWNHDCATSDLTPEKYAALRRRAEGWPWNGYERLFDVWRVTFADNIRVLRECRIEQDHTLEGIIRRGRGFGASRIVRPWSLA